MKHVLAVDLAARVSGWVLLDIGQQPYRVLAHGVINIAAKKNAAGKVEWTELDCWETRHAWGLLLAQGGERTALGYLLDCIAYEVPGGSDRNDSYRGQSSVAQALGIFRAVAFDYTRRLMALEATEVKEAVHGSRTASKLAVRAALDLRRHDGEWRMPVPPPGGDTWSSHEFDAVAVGLVAAARLRMEAMA